jgi:hypothetical protein
MVNNKNLQTLAGQMVNNENPQTLQLDRWLITKIPKRCSWTDGEKRKSPDSIAGQMVKNEKPQNL